MEGRQTITSRSRIEVCFDIIYVVRLFLSMMALWLCFPSLRYLGPLHSLLTTQLFPNSLLMQISRMQFTNLAPSTQETPVLTLRTCQYTASDHSFYTSRSHPEVPANPHP